MIGCRVSLIVALIKFNIRLPLFCFIKNPAATITNTTDQIIIAHSLVLNNIAYSPFTTS
jgi:hypothetical protein